jgi:hypothetical protein
MKAERLAKRASAAVVLDGVCVDQQRMCVASSSPLTIAWPLDGGII